MGLPVACTEYLDWVSIFAYLWTDICMILLNYFDNIVKINFYYKISDLIGFLLTRKEMGGDLAHVALAVQGAPAGSKQSIALAVAAKGM